MLILGCVLFGIVLDRYILPLLDMWLQNVINHQTLSATKIQSQIDEISGGQQQVENISAIGFNYTPTNEFDDEE